MHNYNLIKDDVMNFTGNLIDKAIRNYCTCASVINYVTCFIE